ncbi:MAG: hypothetical protein H6739_06250 [Alphaproteobacteria bacterium]|nr:hypothetical protein [Alphaproteobacteria bacterium]
MLVLLLASTALAYESPAQNVLFEDEANLYESITYDSGWLPSGSPVAVAFRINAEGGAFVEMEGESWMEWPPVLTQGFTPYDEAGWFALDTELGTSVDMKIDIWGYYNEFALAETGTPFFAETTFTPWLLPDGEVTVVEAAASGDTTELFNLSYAIVAGIEVYLTTQLRPDAAASFQGLRVTTGNEVIDIDGGTAVHPAPSTGRIDLDTVFTGLYGGVLDLVFVPTFGACISPFGCYDVASFDIAAPLVDTAFEQDFPAVLVSHPLPQADIDVTDYDFGDVEVGQIATFELPVASLGDLPVEGEIGILGAGEFRVFPDVVFAQGDTVDGVTVTFAPTFTGPQEAELLITTSDPAHPEIRVLVTGNGWEEDKLETIPSEVGCGCTSAPGPQPLAWLGALIGLVALRRRSRRG